MIGNERKLSLCLYTPAAGWRTRIELVSGTAAVTIPVYARRKVCAQTMLTRFVVTLQKLCVIAVCREPPTLFTPLPSPSPSFPIPYQLGGLGAL